MIYYAVADSSTGEVLYVIAKPDGLPAELAPAGCIVIGLDEHPTFPAYVEAYNVLSAPPRPGKGYEWDWQAKAWLLEISSARSVVWDAVKIARNGREFGPFTWGGHVFDGDIDAQRRINLAVLGAQVALAAGQPWSVDWTLADNSFVTLSASDMVGVAEAMGASINAAHEWARGLRIQIDAASTIDELEAVWPASS